MLVSLREAADDLKCNRLWLRGFCAGRGIELHPLGPSLCLTPEDVRQIRGAVDEARTSALGRRRRRDVA